MSAPGIFHSIRRTLFPNIFHIFTPDPLSLLNTVLYEKNDSHIALYLLNKHQHTAYIKSVT